MVVFNTLRQLSIYCIITVSVNLSLTVKGSLGGRVKPLSTLATGHDLPRVDRLHCSVMPRPCWTGQPYSALQGSQSPLDTAKRVKPFETRWKPLLRAHRGLSVDPRVNGQDVARKNDLTHPPAAVHHPAHA